MGDSGGGEVFPSLVDVAGGREEGKKERNEAQPKTPFLLDEAHLPSRRRLPVLSTFSFFSLLSSLISPEHPLLTSDRNYGLLSRPL